MRGLFVAVILGLSAPAFAQVQNRPTDPPLVTAENESWFQLREAIQFAGDLYYPAGAQVFFNGNTMVRTGHYNGVLLYADATLEPFSVVFVPVSRGLMQPYERLRRGDVAGTTGSRAPSFPVGRGVGSPVVGVAVAPTGLPLPIGAVSAYTPGSVAVAPAVASVPPSVVEPSAFIVRGRDFSPIVSLRRPENNDGVWLEYDGRRWVSGGAAIALDETEYAKVGEYAGFPVYGRRGGSDERIYLPSRNGLIAPYQRKP